MTVPIVLRNLTRFPLVFRYRSPQHVVFHKLLDDNGNPQSLQPAGVLMVNVDPGAEWHASIPSAEYVYGSQFAEPYQFLTARIPTTAQPGAVFDISEAGFVHREPAPGGMTGTETGAHPFHLVGPELQDAAMAHRQNSTSSWWWYVGLGAATLVVILILWYVM